MEKINLNEYLASNEYPGRGIAVAMAPDGRQMFIGYFIMAAARTAATACSTPCPSAAASAPSQRTPQNWRTPASLFTIRC